MQVNLLHHGSAFGSLEQAFDPVSNARYAADFLQKLLSQTGSWPRAHGWLSFADAGYRRRLRPKGARSMGSTRSW